MMRLHKILPLSLLVTFLCMMACSSGGTEDADSQSVAENAAAVVNVQQQEVLEGYLQVKDALVQTDGEAASKAAQALAKLLASETEGLLGDIHFDARQIAGMADADDQRVQFESLSDNMYTLLKGNADLGMPVYQQYCPMAFDNQGAAWLAVEKEVNNPYFGDRMLHCGSVQEEL